MTKRQVIKIYKGVDNNFNKSRSYRYKLYVSAMRKLKNLHLRYGNDLKHKYFYIYSVITEHISWSGVYGYATFTKND